MGRDDRAGDAQLRHLVRCVRAADSVSGIAAAVIDCARGATGAAACGLSILPFDGCALHQTGDPDGFARRYAAFTATAVDPIHAALAETHGVVRSNDLFDDEAWRRHSFCRDVAAPFGLEAYMAGELVDWHASRGVIGVARPRGGAAFSLEDARCLQVICLHASVALTRLAHAQRDGSPPERLSPKQQQLVQLVAKGLTNEQIACACSVTTHAVKKALARLFAKTSVASRAELVSALRSSIE